MESMKHGPASWKGPIKGIKRAERERERKGEISNLDSRRRDWPGFYNRSCREKYFY